MKPLAKKLTFILSLILAISLTAVAEDKNSLTDENITSAIEEELLFNATTPAYLIDVSTIDGVVQLTGQVGDLLARDRAVTIAQSVKGVRSVVDRIEVNVPSRPDEDLKDDVEMALLRDPATDSYELKVTATNGMVTLEGMVDSWQEKKLSEFVAKGVSGVKGIDNRITIDFNLDRSDYEIQEDIVQALHNDVRIDDALINVNVKNQKVELTGKVGSANERSLAHSLAWTAGVLSVNTDDLEVVDWARDDQLRKEKYTFKSDEEIRRAVLDAFLYDPRVISFNPDVSVINGTVKLSGTVDNLKAKKAAEQDAKNVVGVINVRNLLKVRPAFIPEDKELQATVEDAISKDPSLSKWEVDVTADNGVVFLNGRVDSYFEKMKSEDIASKIKGVLAVNNNLTVADYNDYYVQNYYGWNMYYPQYNVDVGSRYYTDLQLIDNIESQLWWSPYVNADEVNVIVDNGVATLEGTVDTEREKLFAEINAMEGGAYKVNNNLKVDSSMPN